MNFVLGLSQTPAPSERVLSFQTLYLYVKDGFSTGNYKINMLINSEKH